MSTQPSIEQQVRFLTRVPLFHGLDDKLLTSLAGIMTLTRESAGTVLCREAGPGDACFVIGHGHVEVFIGSDDTERQLATLGPGHVVGEVALIDGKKRSASVRCKTDASIFTLRRDDFDQMLLARNAASMRLLDNIARDLAKRVRTVNERYAAIFSNTGETMATLTRELEALRASTESVETEDEGDDLDLLQLVGYQKSPSSR